MEDQQSEYDSLKRCILRWELKVERISDTDVSWEAIPEVRNRGTEATVW